MHTNDLITVNKDKCLRCGICVETCPSVILNMGEDGPECVVERGCMSCGQCVAVCPVGALDNKYAPLETMRPVTKPMPTAEEAYEYLRMRRSVRAYKPQAPTDEDLTKLLDICRYAPTATNSQMMYYVVMRKPEQIKAVTDLVIDWMEEESANNHPNKRYFATVVRAYKERNVDLIARKAPCLVFMITKRLNTAGVSSAGQCQAYAQLYAPTMGLGTCVAGFVETCGIAGYKPLTDLVGVPPKMKIVGAMMVGYPKYKFHRMPERQHLKVDFRD